MNGNNALSVSVIVVAKHAQDTIGITLESLMTQTHPPDEIILVVDSLDDPTIKAAASFPLKVVQSEAGGIGGARRKGVDTAIGDIISFTDSDCSADKYWLESMMETFLRREDVFVQAGKNVSFRKAGRSYRETENGKDAWFDFAPTMNLSFRRSVIGVVGSFDPYFAEGGEDADFCIRLKKEGFRILYNPRAVIFHLESGKHSKKAWRDGKTRAKNFHKHGSVVLGAASVAIGHSLSLLCMLILLAFGLYVMALLIITPSLLHRVYRATIDLRLGKGLKYSSRGFVFAYVGNLSFLVHFVASGIKPHSNFSGHDA